LYQNASRPSLTASSYRSLAFSKQTPRSVASSRHWHLALKDRGSVSYGVRSQLKGKHIFIYQLVSPFITYFVPLTEFVKTNSTSTNY
jgi:hypothetical protein